MDCTLIRGELVAFQFGSLAPAARSAVEAHLLECTECLRAFIALKREIETAASGPRPSGAARARLRQAVAHEVARARRAASWWRRPLAFGFAAAAAAAAMLAVVAVRVQLHQLAQMETAYSSQAEK